MRLRRAFKEWAYVRVRSTTEADLRPVLRSPSLMHVYTLLYQVLIYIQRQRSSICTTSHIEQRYTHQFTGDSTSSTAGSSAWCITSGTPVKPLNRQPGVHRCLVIDAAYVPILTVLYRKAVRCEAEGRACAFSDWVMYGSTACLSLSTIVSYDIVSNYRNLYVYWALFAFCNFLVR